MITQGPLTAMDRCDRCGAQAYLAAIVGGKMNLLFCAHHAKEHREALVDDPNAVIVVDETERLVAEETTRP